MSKIIKPTKQVHVPLSQVNESNIYEVFAYGNVGGRMRLIRQVPTSFDSNAVTLEFMSPEEFQKAFINKRKRIRITRITDDDAPDDFDFDTPSKRKEKISIVTKTIAELFLQDPSRMTYDRLVFEADPSKVKRTDYNMWTGFTIGPKKGDWALIDRMILESLANGDNESYRYIKRWVAWAFQNPTKRAEAAVVLRSNKQGTGKGLLGNAMCRTFGSHAVHLYRQDSLTTRFNSQLGLCAFLFDDESTYSGDKAAAAVMKGLITEPTIDIERKGVDVITLPNCLKILKATNSKWAVPAEAGDRRYAIFETAEDMANDPKYFAPIVNQLKGDGGAGLRAMLYDLLAMDLKGWHPRIDIPETAARAEQKTMSLTAENKWLLGFLESGVLPFTHPTYLNRVTQQSDFYSAARRNSPELRFKSDVDFSAFLDDWGIESKNSHGRYRDFGTLAALRAKWMERFPWYQGFKDKTVDGWGYERSEIEDAADALDFG